MARSGSKGLKNKNLKKINNVSLVGLAGKICKNVKIIDKAVISTDSNKIGVEAKKHNLEFFFKRPKILSGGKVSDNYVLHHALKKSEQYFNQKFDIILSLPPTTPTRSKSEVELSLKKLINKKYSSIWTISKTDNKFHPEKALYISNKKLKFYNKLGYKLRARQELSDIFHRNGVAYAVSRKLILSGKLIDDNSSYFECKKKHLSIDTFEDLIVARKLFYTDNIQKTG